MYSVLLVDDEPLILSGIKSLLNWEENDCKIIDTARNGQEACDKIRALEPNIVFCDINMPAMSGIDLLQIISGDYPSIVFVMLTNLQDFDLVKNALHYRAVDYLVKSQLEPDVLEHSLANAKKEWDNRNLLNNADYLKNQGKVIHELLWKEIFLRPTPQALSNAPLSDNGQHFDLDSYTAIYLIMDYSLQDHTENHSELFTWEKDLVNAMAQKHFSSFSLFEPDHSCDSLVLLCSAPGEPGAFKQLMEQFYQKLCSSSAKITQVSICMMAAKCFHGLKAMADCRAQLFDMVDHFYNTGQPFLLGSNITPITYMSLGLTGISTHLLEALREKNAVRCKSLLDKAAARIQNINHERNSAIWLCSELYTTVAEIFHDSIPDSRLSSYFSQSENMLAQIEHMHTRSQILGWLEHLSQCTVSAIEQANADRCSFVESAKQFVEDHIEERISLSDAADYVNISPAYLSSIFKKRYGESFIDYVNKCKMEYACKLIKERKYLIYEISYRLGFNNAYYFTKTFKRYTGLTPMEYQNALKNDDVR